MFGVALCWAASVLMLGAVAVIAARTQRDAQEPSGPGFLRAAFRFGWRSHLGAVAQFLQQRVDILLVSYFCTLRSVGVYSLAVGVVELLWYIPQTVANVLMPHVAGSSEEEANCLTLRFCRTVLAINTLISVLLAVLSAWIVPLILPAFRLSIPVLFLFLPGVTAGSVSRILASDLNGRGRPMETFRPAALALAACFFAGLVVIPRFGVIGAAIVASVGHVLGAAWYVRAYSQITTVPAKELLVPRYRDLLFIQQYFRSLTSQ